MEESLSMRRVVVTGIGLVTPLGCGVDVTWQRLIKHESGIRKIDAFDVSDLSSKIAGMIPVGEEPGAFNPDDWLEPKEQRKVDDFILYGIAAASQAVEDSGWQPKVEEDKDRTGVLIGSGIGGLQSIYNTSIIMD